MVNFLMDLVKLVALIGFPNSLRNLRYAVHSPLVQFFTVFHGDAFADVKVGQITQKEANRIADTPVGFGQLFHDLIGNSDIRRIVGRCDPQTQDIRAHLLNDFLWRHHIAARLGHLIALFIHHETVGQHAPEGCNPARADTFQ